MPTFTTPSGKTVNLSRPFGSGGPIYHLTVDGYYWGIFNRVSDQWVWLPQHPERELLGAEDVVYCIGVIEGDI